MLRATRFVPLALLAFALPVLADTITVDRPDDPTPAAAACTTAAADCSLRGAIQVANVTPGTEIVLAAGTYELSANPAFLDVTGPVMLTGAGADTTVVDAGGRDRVMVVRGGATIAMLGVTLAHGAVAADGPVGADGGAVKNLGTIAMVDCVVRDSTTVGEGGGIANAGTLVLTRTGVLGNRSRLEGGGIWNNTAVVTATDSTIDDNESTDESGGGIATFNAATTTLDGCTLSHNRAGTLGGGLFSADFGTATLTNCTVSGNVAKGSGGGLDVTGGTVTLNDVTVADNTGATEDGAGGGIATYTGGLSARNTIVAGNHEPAAPDCSGTIISQGYVLLQQTAGCTLSGSPLNVTGQDPLLGPLADNGGPTPTQALTPGSPAVDAGDPSLPGTGGTSCEVTDQTGTPRPQPAGGRCDIGAFELVQAAATTTTSTSTTTSSSSCTTSLTSTTSSSTLQPGTTFTSTTGTTTSTNSVTTSTAPGTTSTTVPREICGDCIDNDGDGLTDLEDPECCAAAQAAALDLRASRLRPVAGGVGVSLAGIFPDVGLAAGTASTDDVFVQLREAGRADFLCVRIPAADVKRHGRRAIFKDPKHAVASARGVDVLKLKERKNGSGALAVKGRSVTLTLPAAGTLQVTVGLRDPASPGTSRCATVAVPFTAGKKGALKFP
jgi:hypothetical protein